jgi:glycosyltransferase involved in cell wall biosynthesis
MASNSLVRETNRSPKDGQFSTAAEGMKPSISLLVPAYNEEATLAAAVSRAQKAVRTCTDDYEIVLLDDASRDKTAEISRQLAAADPHHIRALRHETNRGIAATFEDLYRAASKDYVFLVPADNEFPPEVLEKIVPMLSHCDVVLCRRTQKPYTTWRKFVSGAYRRLPRLLFGVDLHDAGSIKCVRREIFEQIPVASQGVFVEAERLIRAARRGYRFGVVEIRQELRQAGVARGARFSVVARAFMDMIALWVRLVLLRQQP